jgi:C-terminal processing protease CtpA/Prc
MVKSRLVAGFALAVFFLAACGSESPFRSSTEPDTPDSTARLQSDAPLASLETDEGGPVGVSGEVDYTYPFFTDGVAEPIVILEDQAGFIDRDRNFIFPIESQVLGQITSDFYSSPFSYSLTLPEEPRGSLRDVDNDAKSDPGVMTFAVAYWTNAWGDPYLEKRDQHGGGWSTAYASTRISDDRDTYLEVFGGKYLIYAPEEGQGFPTGFGEDGLLFTDDDPIVTVPLGWTLVDLDTDPFTFDRSREVVIPLVEPEQIALDDFSNLSYSEAFEAMLEKMRTEYAFTELKVIDWDQLASEYRPLFEAADEVGDPEMYLFALRDFLWSIPDGHIGMDTSVFSSQFREEVSGGLGFAMRELDDGRFIVDFLLPGGPAEAAGMQLGAEVIAIDQTPVAEVVEDTIPWSSPFSTEHNLRLEQARYATRSPFGSQIEITYQNPDEAERNAQLQSVSEFESFDHGSFSAERTGYELPVEFEFIEDGYGYAVMSSFFDDEVLTIQLWERMIQDLNATNSPGLIIDMRYNGGGSGFLADQMAAYFFDEELSTGNSGFYDDSTGDFYTDPGDERFLFPPREELRYTGSVAVIVGPSCASACEFFSYAMTLEDRAIVVGQYPSAGLGGSVEDFLMPEMNSVRFTIGRAVDPEGEIHIEGTGVVPTVQVPLTEEIVLASESDPVLEFALDALQSDQQTTASDGGPRLASRAESEAALQREAPLLEEYGAESYEDRLSNPGTYSYTLSMSPADEAIWAVGWCAEQERFEDNWEAIDLELSMNDAPVPLERLHLLEFESQGELCRFFFVMVTDWPTGNHRLQTLMRFSEEIDDGISTEPYAPGARTFEYIVESID